MWLLIGLWPFLPPSRDSLLASHLWLSPTPPLSVFSPSWSHCSFIFLFLFLKCWHSLGYALGIFSFVHVHRSWMNNLSWLQLQSKVYRPLNLYFNRAWASDPQSPVFSWIASSNISQTELIIIPPLHPTYFLFSNLTLVAGKCLHLSRFIFSTTHPLNNLPSSVPHKSAVLLCGTFIIP